MQKASIGVALLIGCSYFVIGFSFGRLAGSSASEQGLFAWRLSAWILSACIYTAHFWYEHFRLRNAPRIVAFHTALGVVAGAFLLAVSAIVNSFMTASGNRPLLFLALVAWPMLTGLPAFVVAFVGSALLARLWRKD